MRADKLILNEQIDKSLKKRQTALLITDKQFCWESTLHNQLSVLGAKKDKDSFCTQTLKHIYCGKTNDLLAEEKIKNSDKHRKNNTRGSNARKIYGSCLAYAYTA